MKTFTLAAAAVAVLATSVAAQTAGEDEGRLYYTEPVTATVWKAGSNHTVSWSNKCKPGNQSKLDIVLYIGTGKSANDQIRVLGMDAIGQLDCMTSNSAQVFLPANLTTSNLYSIHVDTEPLQSYSAQFTIQGIDPPKPTTPAAPSTAPGATPSAPAGSSSSGAPPSESNEAKKPENAAGSLKIATSVVAALAVAAGALMA